MDDKSRLELILVFGLGLVAVIIRAVYLSGAFTIKKLLRALLFGGFVGACMFMIVYDIDVIPPMVRGALVGVGTMFAEDIVFGLKTLFRQYREDPLSVIEKFWPWGGGK